MWLSYIFLLYHTLRLFTSGIKLPILRHWQRYRWSLARTITLGSWSRSAIFHSAYMETSLDANFWHVLSAQGLWAGRVLYRATPAVTRGLGFSGLIWRTASFSRLLRHTRGCGGSFLTRILQGLWVDVCLFDFSCTSNFSAIWRLSPLPARGLHI
jgi:hypothetical protein